MFLSLNGSVWFLNEKNGLLNFIFLFLCTEETFNKEKKVMGEQVAKDKRVEGHYKKTDNSELQPLVSSAAPAAAAVVTQDDHGSPTIKISEDTDDKEEKGEE